jgi:GAF domain-containing protein
MNPLVDPLEKLIDAAKLLEKPITLEEKLQELARLTAKVLKTKRCSILLLSDREPLETSDRHLKVFAHYGNLPDAAYNEQIALNQSIAGYVATQKKALLIEDIRSSPLAAEAKYLDEPDKSLMSAPITDNSVVIGIINVSFPIKDKVFTEDDLQLLEIFAAFVSKSLQITQLQMILRSKFLENAVRRELKDEEIKEYMAIHPNPNKLAKMVAKSFFRELTQAGFGPNEVINISTEVLTLLNESLEKHRQRLAREDLD